jgi:hypothetical protein
VIVLGCDPGIRGGIAVVAIDDGAAPQLVDASRYECRKMGTLSPSPVSRYGCGKMCIKKINYTHLPLVVTLVDQELQYHSWLLSVTRQTNEMR